MNIDKLLQLNKKIEIYKIQSLSLYLLRKKNREFSL